MLSLFKVKKYKKDYPISIDFLYIFVTVEEVFCCTGSFDKRIWLPDWFSQETLFKMALIFSVCT